MRPLSIDPALVDALGGARNDRSAAAGRALLDWAGALAGARAAEPALCWDDATGRWVIGAILDGVPDDWRLACEPVRVLLPGAPGAAIEEVAPEELRPARELTGPERAALAPGLFVAERAARLAERFAEHCRAALGDAPTPAACRVLASDPATRRLAEEVRRAVSALETVNRRPLPGQGGPPQHRRDAAEQIRGFLRGEPGERHSPPRRPAEVDAAHIA